MKYFVILSAFVIFSMLSPSYALIASYTPEELYEIYDILILGEILDYTDIGTSSHYDIKVIQSLKNSQPGEILQAIGSGVHYDGVWIEDSTIFEIGEIAILYVENNSNTLQIGPYSYSAQLDLMTGGGSLDPDPASHPSFSNDFVFSWTSIFVFGPLASGVIASILLLIHLILKKKNIPSRPYITIISAAIMLYFGISTLSVLGTIVLFLQQESPWHYSDQIIGLLSYPIIGFSLTGLGITFLYKSSLIRRLIRR